MTRISSQATVFTLTVLLTVQTSLPFAASAEISETLAEKYEASKEAHDLQMLVKLNRLLQNYQKAQGKSIPKDDIKTLRALTSQIESLTDSAIKTAKRLEKIPKRRPHNGKQVVINAVQNAKVSDQKKQQILRKIEDPKFVDNSLKRFLERAPAFKARIATEMKTMEQGINPKARTTNGGSGNGVDMAPEVCDLLLEFCLESPNPDWCVHWIDFCMGG